MGDRQRMCVNCGAWQPPTQGSMGQCRLRPPRAFMLTVPSPGQSKLTLADRPQTMQVEPMFLSAWPPTPPEGWCSEWKGA